LKYKIHSGSVLAAEPCATIPVVYVTGEFTWGPDVLVIPEYAFGARVNDAELTLSGEHAEYRWFTLDEAVRAVQWDSNRTALWELDHRLRHGMVHRGWSTIIATGPPRPGMPGMPTGTGASPGCPRLTPRALGRGAA
jgi:hypothetical protein